MKLNDSVKLQEEASKEILAIRIRKGHDYAKPDADCLSNFKVMAAVARSLKDHGYEIDITTPQGVTFWHMLHKVVRILNLWNENVQPQNEGLHDSHNDLACYNTLAEHNYIDYQKEKLNTQRIHEALRNWAIANHVLSKSDDEKILDELLMKYRTHKKRKEKQPR